ncbi:MAG: hypothetical protein NC102_00515 [Clostridium sp.]|nr:hypothetical protein [Clostridium sp.]
MKSKFYYFALAAGALMLSACSDSDNDGENGGNGTGSMEEYTSEESKQYLTETATEVMNLLNPSDQADAISLAAYFTETFGDFDLPSNFDFESNGGKSYSPADFFSNLGRGARGEVDALSRSVYTYTYNINFERCAGIYEPVRGEWAKTGNSDDIIFRFNDANNAACELKATKSGSNSDIDFNYTEEDYYDTEEYYYYISIPQTVNVSLKQGSKSLFEGKVISSIDVKGHSLSVDASATLANISAASKVTGNDNEINGNATITIDGKEVATSSAKVNGKHLCDKSYLEDKLSDDDLYSLLSSGEAKADVLGKVQAYGNGTYYSGMEEDLDTYYGSWDDLSKDQAQSKMQSVCDRLNKNIKVYLRYDGTATDQAKLSFVPEFEEWGTSSYPGWEYWISQNLVFPDGTSYNMESYFDRFTSVSSKWQSLLDAYERAWNRAVR